MGKELAAMQLLRIPNYFFVGLRLGFALVMTSLYLGVVLFAPAPDPADKDGFDKGIFAVLMPFVIIPFIIAAVRAIVRVELNGGLVVRRLLWTRRYDWKDVTGLAFTTSTGSFSFIPVAKFRSANFNFQSGGRLYFRVTPQEERSITSFLA